MRKPGLEHTPGTAAGAARRSGDRVLRVHDSGPREARRSYRAVAV